MIPKGPGGTNREGAGFGFRWYLEDIFTSPEEDPTNNPLIPFGLQPPTSIFFISHLGRTDSPEGSNLFYPLPHFPHGFSRALTFQHESSQAIFFHPDFFQDPSGVGHSPSGPGTAHQIPAGLFRASEEGHSIGTAFQRLGKMNDFHLSGTGKRNPAKFTTAGTIHFGEDLMDLFSLLGTVKNGYMNL
jgi:hypothetical protein